MPKRIVLKDISTLPVEKITEEEANKETKTLIDKLNKIQNKLYAQRKYGVLIVLQGMDAAGKDSAVKHVFSGVDPTGCNVKAFKVPTIQEAAHHFLWRINSACPEKGMTQIFNRSHYEDILVPFVNKSIPDKLIKERCKEINMFERGLQKDNTIILKFYLHVSHKEQLKRVEERKTDEHKRWKYQKADVIAVRKHDEYAKAYNFVFEHCNKDVQWQIVPADRKWYKDFYILRAIVKELEKYDIHYPRTEL